MSYITAQTKKICTVEDSEGAVMIGAKSVERVAPRGSEVVGRRRFITGSLGAGAAVTAGAAAWKAWPQSAPLPTPTIPIQCVPPVPFGQPSAFIPDGGPIQIRKSAFELNASEVSRLKAAYAALLKVTKDNDPRGWYRQGAVHCWYCSGAADGLNGTEIHGDPEGRSFRHAGTRYWNHQACRSAALSTSVLSSQIESLRPQAQCIKELEFLTRLGALALKMLGQM